MNDGNDLFRGIREDGWIWGGASALLSAIVTIITRRGRRKDRAEVQQRDRAAEVWDQAAQLRAEYRELLAESKAREAEFLRQLRDLEHQIGNLKTRDAAWKSRWNALVRELKSRPGDEWNYLPEYPENGGTKEIQKS